MIKIFKNLSKVPNSLNSPTTQARREELIQQGHYINNETYNSRYKSSDVKKTLKAIYNSKCAFCEQRIERFDVEHFRPKSIYPWLAYSWDNLLLACPTCNGNKDVHFETLSNMATYSLDFKTKIHQSTEDYNTLEGNHFVHPEFEDVEPLLDFDKNGVPTSQDQRLKYTIEKCRIDRDDLNELRQYLFDKIKKRMFELFLEFQKSRDRDFLVKINGLKEEFILDSNDPKIEFLAFRRFVVRQNFDLR